MTLDVLYYICVSQVRAPCSFLTNKASLLFPFSFIKILSETKEKGVARWFFYSFQCQVYFVQILSRFMVFLLKYVASTSFSAVIYFWTET